VGENHARRPKAEAAKGGVPRDIGLSPILLSRLQVYLQRLNPMNWLFPSGMRPDYPMERKSSLVVMPVFSPRQVAGRKGGRVVAGALNDPLCSITSVFCFDGVWNRLSWCPPREEH
jgi:hypothetical protein